MMVIASILTLGGFMPQESIKDPLLLSFGAGVAGTLYKFSNYEH